VLKDLFPLLCLEVQPPDGFVIGIRNEHGVAGVKPQAPPPGNLFYDDATGSGLSTWFLVGRWSK